MGNTGCNGCNCNRDGNDNDEMRFTENDNTAKAEDGEHNNSHNKHNNLPSNSISPSMYVKRGNRKTHEEGEIMVFDYDYDEEEDDDDDEEEGIHSNNKGKKRVKHVDDGDSYFQTKKVALKIKAKDGIGNDDDIIGEYIDDEAEINDHNNNNGCNKHHKWESERKVTQSANEGVSEIEQSREMMLEPIKIDESSMNMTNHVNVNTDVLESKINEGNRHNVNEPSFNSRNYHKSNNSDINDYNNSNSHNKKQIATKSALTNDVLETKNEFVTNDNNNVIPVHHSNNLHTPKKETSSFYDEPFTQPNPIPLTDIVPNNPPTPTHNSSTKPIFTDDITSPITKQQYFSNNEQNLFSSPNNNDNNNIINLNSSKDIYNTNLPSSNQKLNKHLNKKIPKHNKSNSPINNHSINNSNNKIGLSPFLENKITKLIKSSSRETKKNNNNNISNNQQSLSVSYVRSVENENKQHASRNNNNNNNTSLNISNDKATSLFEVSRIQFGIEKKDDLSQDEQKFLEVAQKNLEQFYPPQKQELSFINLKLQQMPITSILPSHQQKQSKSSQKKHSSHNNNNNKQSSPSNTQTLSYINPNSNKEMLFHGELQKLINYEINAHKPQMYSTRFCLLFEDEFRYYKSKEQFLTKQKPLCVVPLCQITKIYFAKKNKSINKVDHIILCNKLGIYNRKRSVFKMFDSAERNAYLTLPGSNESLLIFTSNNLDKIYEWYVLLSHFIKKNKVNDI